MVRGALLLISISSTVIVAALLYTHHPGGLYLVITVVIVLAAIAARPERRPIVALIRRRTHRRLLAVAAVAAELSRFQSHHTATPGWLRPWRHRLGHRAANRLGLAGADRLSSCSSPARSSNALARTVVPAAAPYAAADRRHARLSPRRGRSAERSATACTRALHRGRVPVCGCPCRRRLLDTATFVALAPCSCIVAAVLSSAVAIHEIGVPWTTAPRLQRDCARWCTPATC